jgi:hypothetical protein
VAEGAVEAEDGGERSTSARGDRNALTVESCLLDLGGGDRNVRVHQPVLARGVELPGIEPIEQLAEEVGVVLTHT